MNEGYAEYGAHISHIKRDSTVSLAGRIKELLNQSIWINQDRAIRDTHQWELMVEYPAEIGKYDFANIMNDGVTLDKTYSEMIRRYEQQ